MNLSQNEERRLVQAACDARQRAYAPYSKFHVGAALLAVDSTIHCGCNVENASYGLTICAERVAIGNAVAASVRTFQALAIVAHPAVPPCGACRQVLAEFAQDLPILLVDAEQPERIQRTTLAQLLPLRFVFD